MSNNLALYAAVGPVLTRYTVDVDQATLAAAESISLPANIHYVVPHAQRHTLYVATSDSSSGSGNIVGKNHHLSAFRIDRASGKLMDVEGRIEQCRVDRQGAQAPRRESDEMLSLSTYVSHQSRGMPVQVNIEGAAKPHFEAGRAAYYRRQGQLNLSCAQCHEANRGRKLLTETISQGHGTGYPGYRLEWQNQGSLERRLRACFSGIRAEMHSYGAPEHLDLVLFLAWRAQGLPVRL